MDGWKPPKQLVPRIVQTLFYVQLEQIKQTIDGQIHFAGTQIAELSFGASTIVQRGELSRSRDPWGGKRKFSRPSVVARLNTGFIFDG